MSVSLGDPSHRSSTSHDTAHTTLLQLLGQCATGALTQNALTILLEAPALRAALAALVGQKVTVTEAGDTITVGNITNAEGIAFGTNALAIGEFILQIQRPLPIPAFQVPFPPSPLIGRAQELESLATLLLGEKPVALTPAITGMGGVGKTFLAVTFARVYQKSFPGGVFWLNMGQPAGIRVQVAMCAGPTGLDLPGYDGMRLEERITRVKAAWNSVERRLLVFDNLEDPSLLQEWQPTGGSSRVLITTRRDDWPHQIQRLQLPVLPRPESKQLVLGARPKEQRYTMDDVLRQDSIAHEVDVICDLLGDLPIALAIAAAYLRQYPSLTLQRYREQIEANPLIDDTDPAIHEVLAEAGLPTGRECSILAIFAMSYQLLDSTHPTDALALRMLHGAAYCAPAPILQELLWHVGEVADDSMNSQQQRDAALRRLRATGLITMENEGESPLVLLHRLIAAYVRSQQHTTEAQAAVEQAMLAILTTHQDAAGYLSDIGTLLPHLRHLTDQALLRHDATSATLAEWLAYYLQQLADYPTARLYYEQALVIREQVLGPLHPDTANSLNNLGYLLRMMGELPTAQPYYERALAIQEHVLGQRHPDTARSLNNLGSLLRAMGKLPAARLYYERALAIREQVLGLRHPDTATSLSNLGSLLHDMGDLGDAQTYLEQALDIRKEALSPRHPDTATSLNNLGLLHKTMGQMGHAQFCLEQALDIRKEVLGLRHPDTAISFYNLSALLHAMGNLSTARSYYEDALAIGAQTVGTNHPLTKSFHEHYQLLLQQLKAQQ